MYDKISNKQYYGREINDLRFGPVKEPRTPLMGAQGTVNILIYLIAIPYGPLADHRSASVPFALKPKLYLGSFGSAPMGFLL